MDVRFVVTASIVLCTVIRRFPVVIVLNQPIACQGGEGRVVIGSPQKRIGSRKKCVALLQTLLLGELKSSRQNVLGRSRKEAECSNLPAVKKRA